MQRRGHAGGRSQRRQAFKRVGRRRSHVVARFHQNHQVPCGELHTRKSEKTPRSYRGWWNTQEAFVQVSEGRDGRTPFERLHGKKPTQQFVPFEEKVLARPISSEPLNRKNLGYKFGVWLGVRNYSAECFVETAEGPFSAREIGG